MNCLICSSLAKELFVKIIIGKHGAHYHQYEACGFIGVNPHEALLAGAYSSAITKTDLGLLSRNLRFAGIFERVLLRHFYPEKPFLDHAGGYGVFIRLIRDHGFNFHHEENYCGKLLASNFWTARRNIDHSELVTEFEFTEHPTSPVQAVSDILQRTESFLFSTEIPPNKNWRTSQQHLLGGFRECSLIPLASRPIKL
jgi:hypothetical protein